MKKELNFYKESGIAPPINLIFSFLISSLLMVAISYFYSLIITFLPFIYFNFIVVVLYAYAACLITNYFNGQLKIRNRKKSLIVIFMVALGAYYFQWVSYLYLLSSEQVTLFFEPEFYFEIFLSPLLVVENLILLNKFGSWEMFSIPFKGFILWVIWAAEFLMIMLTVYFGFQKIKIKPFSENDNNWYRKDVLEKDFEAIKLRKDFIREYTENPIHTIKNLASGNGFRYSKIYLYSSKSNFKNLLSIDNEMVTRSEGKKEKDQILGPHYISKEEAIELKNSFKVKEKSFFDFFHNLYS